jgi:hypothetical protein
MTYVTDGAAAPGGAKTTAGLAPVRRPVAFRAALLASLLLAAACSSPQQGEEMAGRVPDATVEIEQAQVAFIGSGTGGSGVLHYRGRSYPFTANGVGVGGIGASSIMATGDVYGLPDVSRFPGVYAQGRAGFAIGQTSAGDLWLRNEAGVTMHLKAKRTGLMLSLGGDAMRIAWTQ